MVLEKQRSSILPQIAVNIGFGVFSSTFVNETYYNAVDVLKYVQNALNDAGHGHRIKATIPHYTDVLDPTTLSMPSKAMFRPDIEDRMKESITFLKENNAPLMVNLYPIHYVQITGLHPEFAFMDNKSDFVVEDENGKVYTNAFEFLYDSFYWACFRVGGENMTIKVGQIGWPTDGYPGANIDNAYRFYKEFLPFVTSNKGTPMVPGAPIDVFLHSLTDENRLSPNWGAFQRHWGIYRFNGEPKYKIDFSGKNRDIWPTIGKGIIRMPKRWCVFNGNTKDLNLVREEQEFACNASDCTSMVSGGSCSNLSFDSKVSYAFNNYFQAKAQKSDVEETCYMKGLGNIVTEDPSTGTCSFQVSILESEVADTNTPTGGEEEKGSGERLRGCGGLGIMILPLSKGGEAEVGISWGRQTSQRFIPSMAVDILLQNGINEAMIFHPAENVLAAFSNSNISITVSMTNANLPNINSTESARRWVDNRISIYTKHNVNIRAVNIGFGVFSLAFMNETYYNAVDVLKLVQNALNDAGHGHRIKATIPHFTDVLDPTTLSMPSKAMFRPDIKDRMEESIIFLRENNAPLMINIYPIHYVQINGLHTEFAFMDNKSDFVVEDENGKIYNNAFEFLYDSFYWACFRAGGENMTIKVGQIGWPTDGYPGANIDNAYRFYKGFLPFVTSNKGTPMVPGAPIDVFLHSLSDENRLSLKWGAFQRHWGIYRFNGEPKYKIDFTGKNRDIWPSMGKGIIRMPKRWCVFNGDTKDLNLVREEQDIACNVSDCTSMLPGGSCSNLSFDSKVSYAFNNYFQAKAQKSDVEKTCYMKGLGNIVTDDPSIGTCIFQVSILQSEVADTNLPITNMSTGVEELTVSGERSVGWGGLSMHMVILPFILIFWGI
ncbi:hypothetical protein ACJIZ3_022955 [Penstemon smallii]|uniref:X8 domain-containing protein n=1 Tax=Penstemon smallii TaxID=265156 RepID=A0ABD3TMT0_9LAMI